MDQGRKTRDQVVPAVMPLVANDMCIQMHVLAYDIGNFPRTLATSETIKDLSLTILRGRCLTAFLRRHPVIDRRTAAAT
jgi:hypothetical protein